MLHRGEGKEDQEKRRTRSSFDKLHILPWLGEGKLAAGGRGGEKREKTKKKEGKGEEKRCLAQLRRPRFTGKRSPGIQWKKGWVGGEEGDRKKTSEDDTRACWPSPKRKKPPFEPTRDKKRGEAKGGWRTPCASSMGGKRLPLRRQGQRNVKA